MAVWPDQKALDHIAAMLKSQSYSARDICEELGITMYRLSRILSDYRSQLKVAIEVARLRVVVLRQQGRDYHWIARHTGWPRQTCMRWCDDAGLVSHRGLGRCTTARDDIDLLDSIRQDPVASLLTIPWTPQTIADWRARHAEAQS